MFDWTETSWGWLNIIKLSDSTLNEYWFAVCYVNNLPVTSGLFLTHQTDQIHTGTWYHHPRRLQCVKFSKLQRDIIDAVTISKIIVFEIICNVAYYYAAKITFPIAQSSNKATKCDIKGFWKLKVKPNLGCCSNIALTISYISVFVSSW